VAYRIDMVIDQAVVVEVKALETIAPIHSRRLRTYLLLSKFPVGLLLNFGAATMTQGIKRVANHFPDH
jgi:iron complex transport system substrate-binding protein